MKYSAGTVDDIQEILNQKAKKKDLIMSIVPFMGFVIITLVMAIATKGVLFKQSNLVGLIVQAFTITIVGVGAVFVYAHGGMDFSIGTTSGLAQFACVFMLVRMGAPIWVGILCSILVGVLACSTVGMVAIGLNVHPFVGSLCVKTIAAGLLSVFTDNSGGQISLEYTKYMVFNNAFLRLGILIAVVALGYYLFEKTSLGKAEKAIGGNSNTVEQAGVDVKRHKFLAYVILGVCVGIAAFFQLTRMGSVSSGSGSGLEFDMMIAMVLGGFPMSGGSGAKFRQFMLGGITMIVLTNGLIICGLAVSLVAAVKGLILILVVSLTYDRSIMKQVTVVQV